jgi:ketosteroid isomerase-like protein
MSEENVEIVRRAYDALDGRDWEALFSDTRPEFRMETQLQGSYRGREAVQAFLEDQDDSFGSWSTEPQEFFDTKDQVAVIVKVTAKPKGSSAAIEIKNGHLWTLQGGAILSLTTFPKPGEALEAAGLSE